MQPFDRLKRITYVSVKKRGTKKEYVSSIYMYIRNRIKIEMIFIQCVQAQKGRIKMNKKLLSLFITAAMLTPAMSALADDVELISAPETVFETETAAPAMNKLTGVVASVENGIANITIADGELTADYGFGLTDKTPLYTIDGEEATELKAGDNVVVFTDSSLKTKDIKTAEAIVILSEENTTTAVVLDVFANTELGLLSSTGQLVLNVEDEKIAEYNNKNLLVFYDFATMSIPAQTNPVKVVVLEESEKMQNVEISFCIGDSILSINGSKVEVEAPYIAGEGVTLVPLRVISEAFGAEVNWDGDTKTVTIAHNDNNISVQIDNNTAVVNGENKTLEESPELTVNGITMLPLRFISEELGATVGYEHETQAISVSMDVVAY